MGVGEQVKRVGEEVRALAQLSLLSPLLPLLHKVSVHGPCSLLAPALAGGGAHAAGSPGRGQLHLNTNKHWPHLRFPCSNNQTGILSPALLHLHTQGR